MWDYSKSLGNPDGLFEMEEGQSEYETDKVIEELNKFALGEKYTKIQPEGRDKVYALRIK